MSSSDSYVRADKHGVRRIGETRVMLDSIVASFQQGHSPETIQQQYPALTLEEVYGAITYYLSHVEEVKAYLEQQGKVWDHWRAKSGERRSAVVERLRALQEADVSEDS